MSLDDNIKILDYKELTLEHIEFSHPKKVKGGSYISEAYYKGADGNQKIFIQTPKLLNTSGIVKNDSRCYTELELDQTHYPFFKFVTDLDDHNIVNIQKNSLSWFNKHFPIDIVEEFYKTPIKIGKNKSPPKLKLKIPVSKNSITCNIFDESKNVIDFTAVKKSSKVISVIEFVGLRFLKQQVLCEWNPVQIKLCDTIRINPQKYLINEDLLTDDEDEHKLETDTSVLETIKGDAEVKPEFDMSPINDEESEESDNTALDLMEVEPNLSLENNEDIQATLNSEPKLVIDELTENKISETNTREAIENLIVEEIKNEIEADAEEDLNLLSNITERPDNDYNELLNVQSLLEKTQQELELYKKMTTEKDHRILELKNQFKQFVQNLA